MDNCLLIGNGLNRCIKHGISWGNLLEEIAINLNVSYNPEITMPLEFERIVNEYLTNYPSGSSLGDIYYKVKQQIANNVAGVALPSDAIHHRIKNMKLDAILTTNYDTLVEKVFDYSYSYCGNKQKKYLFEPTTHFETTDFYHIHGVADNPNSLCLGYEHYMGMVEKLRATLNTKKEGKINEMFIKRILYGEEKSSNTWGERFYTSNIAIIGLELSECESDLWWLITHRAYLYYSNYALLNSECKIKNNVVFYDIIDERRQEKSEDIERQISKNRIKKNRHKLLEGEHVIVKPLILGKKYGTYEEAYNAAIDDIEVNGITIRRI